MSGCDMYDSALLGILQNEGEIVKFLDIFFSFLHRKTDFYLLMKSSQDRMGFPPGAAQMLVMSAFKKYESLAAQIEARKQKQITTAVDATKSPSTKNKSDAVVNVPPIALVEEVTTSVSPDTSSTNPTVSIAESMPCTASDSSSTAAENPVVVRNETTEDDKTDVQTSPAVVVQSDVSVTLNSASTSEKKLDEDDPELANLQKVFQANPESYNGALRDNYSWSQSINDVDVRVKVPAHVRRGADVKVDIGKKRLRVSYKNTDGSLLDAINGELTWDVHKDESMWSLIPGEHIHVNLEKVQERWWEAVLTDEPKISVRKIDPSRPMTDLDDEAQAKIEELVYNEQQKRLGLPQSHEQKTHEILRQAWDAEGSPFKGTPFDPSIVNVTPGPST